MGRWLADWPTGLAPASYRCRQAGTARIRCTVWQRVRRHAQCIHGTLSRCGQCAGGLLLCALYPAW
eukprot:2214446-Heterocapsa_arctica.AAC.1